MENSPKEQPSLLSDTETKGQEKGGLRLNSSITELAETLGISEDRINYLANNKEVVPVINEYLKNLTRKELEELKNWIKGETSKQQQERLQILEGTAYKLATLKSIIKTNFEYNLSSNYENILIQSIDHIEKIQPPSSRPMFLSGIFHIFNKMGIVYELNGDGITLLPGKRKTKSEEFLTKLKTLETAFNSAGIEREIILKSFLYSSGKLDRYIESKIDGKYNVNEYLLFLFETYSNIKEKIIINEDKNDKSSEIVIKVKNEQEYKSLREKIKEALFNNPNDVAFVLSYLDDIYYKRESSYSKNTDMIKEYKETTTEIEKQFLESVNKLSEEEKAVLGVTSPDRLKELQNMVTHNPVELFQEGLKNGGLTLGVIFGIMGAIFKGWQGFFAGLSVGFVGSIVGIDGIKGLISELGEKKGGKNKNDGGIDKNILSNTQNIDIQKNTNSIFEKYKGLFNGEKLKIWKELSEDEKFLNAEASILNIFKNESDVVKIKEEFKKNGIELIDDNMNYYEYIFSKIIKEREKTIGFSRSNETIRSYLERTSKNNNVILPQLDNLDNTNIENKDQQYSIEQKRAILAYFNINENEIFKIETELKSLNLDIYKLLDSYKKFIETNLTGLDEIILNKIKLSITRRLGLIIGEIDILKKDDYYKTDFINNRWIINSKIQDIFSEINNKVFPSAYILRKYIKDKNKGNNYTKEQKEKIERIKQMFNAELTDTGEFDKKFWSRDGFGEIWDSLVNNWEVYDITNEDDLKFLKENGFKENDLLEISILSEKDKEIEKEAQMWFLATIGVLVANDIASFSGIWTIPGIVIGTGYAIGDAFTQEDLAFKILKGTGLIPEEYRVEQSMWDRIISGASIIPGVFALAKGKTVASFTSKMSKEDLLKFNKMQEKIKDILKNGFKGGDKNNIVDGIGLKKTIKNNIFGDNISIIFPNKKENLIKYFILKDSGNEVMIGNKVIKKKLEGKYEFNGKIYDKIDHLIPELSKDIDNVSIINKMRELSTGKINKVFNEIKEKEIKIGDNIFRFREELGTGKRILEIKNGTGWNKKSIEDLNEIEAQVLLDKLLGDGNVQKIIGRIKALNSIPINSVVSTKDKNTIIKRFGQGAWDAIVWVWNTIGKEFENIREPLTVGNKLENVLSLYGEKRFTERRLESVLGRALIGARGGTPLSILLGIILNEGVEIYQAGGINERYNNYNVLTDGFDTIMTGYLFKKVSFIRAIIYQTIWESTLGNN